MKKPFLFTVYLFLSFILTGIVYAVTYDIWITITTVLLCIIFSAIWFQFSFNQLSSKEIALVAVLGAVSAVSRLPFAAIPSVQPCTFLIICTGYVFGASAGLLVASITVFISNLFLGHGPWSIFQILAWGLAGVSAAWIAKIRVGLSGLLVWGVVWSIVFGWIMNLWYWLLFIYPHTYESFFLGIMSSIWFDVMHAVGTVVFFIVLGPQILQIFYRYQKRFHVQVVSASSEGF